MYKFTQYDLPQGCSINLGGPCFGAKVNVLGGIKYQTGNQCTKPLLHRLGRVIQTSTGAYMPLAVHGNLIWAYIHACGSQRVYKKL